MKWQPISKLPSELVDESLLLRIETRRGGMIIFIMGYVTDDGEVYTDERFNEDILGGHLSRDFWRNVWYVDPKEIELTK